MVVNARISFIHVLVFILTTFTTGLGKTKLKSAHRGICQVYNGTYCKSILNSTELHFINTSLGFDNTENVTIELEKQIKIIFETSSAERINACRDLLEKVVCHFVFPPCSSNGQRLQWCREDCRYLFSICGAELNKLVGAGKAVLHGKLSSVIFRFDECQDFMSKQDHPGKNGSCAHLPFINIPPEDKTDHSSSKVLIILLCVLIPLVVFSVALIFYKCREHRKRRSLSVNYNSGKENGTIKKARLSNVVSMRDRIREWKVAPSELVELVDICKSRGVQEIPVDNIEYLKDLGSGQYGLVFQGKVNKDIEGEPSRIVAVKTLREGSSPEAIKEFCHEVNIMSTFSHPHVVKLIGVSLAEEPYCMIFEFVEFGDLASFLRKCAEVKEVDNSVYPKLTVIDQLAMATQVASGMKYIASIRCVHRDLAARNCLVGRGLVVKISDFGLSRDVYVSEYYRMDKTRMLPVRWLPPEAFVDGKFTTRSDVYSYGVLLWEIFTFAKLPYEEYDNAKTMELILDGKRLSQPEKCPDAVFEIMKKCWEADPEERLLFPEIVDELCSLDDYGQRFQAGVDNATGDHQGGTLHHNSLQMSFQKAENTLSYSNSGVDVDEPPINVERLPDKEKLTTEQSRYYSTPKLHRADQRQEIGPQVGYDGVVTLSESAEKQYAAGREPTQPKAVQSQTPPPDTEISRSSTDPEGSQNKSPRGIFRVSSKSKLICEDREERLETYNVPPGINSDNDDGEDTYDVPPVPLHDQRDEAEQETYDVPPAPHASLTFGQSPEGYDEGPQETYDVPPKISSPPISHAAAEGPQETYDVPPASLQRQLSQSSMLNDTDDQHQETYAVPPKHEETFSDKIHQNPTRLRPELYSVPQSPYLQRRKQESDSSPPDNQTKTPPPNLRHPYENVDFDGKPLLY